MVQPQRLTNQFARILVGPLFKLPGNVFFLLISKTYIHNKLILMSKFNKHGQKFTRGYE